jgi:hypothetical protein
MNRTASIPSRSGRSSSSAGEKGLFAKDVELNLLPEEARAFAQSLRSAPGIHARLKSAIDLDAIYRK